MSGAVHNLFNHFQNFLFCSSSLSRNYNVSLLMTNLTQIQFEMNLVKENDSFSVEVCVKWCCVYSVYLN